MMTIYVLSGFNNYYNRIVKKFDTMEEYQPFVTHEQTDYNFVPNDGVNTTVVLGNIGNDYLDDGDYLIALDNDTSEIHSRWFVIESKRDRGGQYTLTLHRDLVVDYWNIIKDSPCFIEKATIKDISSPLLYNSEDMTFNQIKMSETRLFDKTMKPWIVGYIAPDAENIWKEYATLDSTFSYPLTNYQTIRDYADNPNKFFVNASIQYNSLTIANQPLNADNKQTRYAVTFDKNISYTESYLGHTDFKLNFGAEVNNVSNLPSICEKLREECFSNESFMSNLLVLSGSTETDYTQLRGRVVVDQSTGTFYRIDVTESAVQSEWPTFTGNSSSSSEMRALRDIVLSEVRGIEGVITNTPTIITPWYEFDPDYWPYGGLPVLRARIDTRVQTLTLTQLTTKGLSVTLPATAKQLEDAPYYMFAMPYSESNMRLAVHIGVSLGDNCYDIQLLPYCPVQDYYFSDGSVNLSGLTANKDYSIVYKEGAVDSYMFWCPFSNITFDLTRDEFKIAVPIDPVEFKVHNDTRMYRLCSPNGNGEFQFSATKNSGVSGYNVDCTFRPINPYIHINPRFAGLYGADFNDFRGLILQGDFSIPRLSDQWVNFEINAKNYQNSFNRQIEYQELQNKYQRVGDIVGAITGTGAGAATGALVGSSLVPGIGTAAGAIAGGVMSAAGGITDAIMGEKLRRETLDLTKDQFNYNLQNIQARPQSIVKTGCLTFNNKLVPYIEEYRATGTEEQALRNKMKYNGMTIMVIDTINTYAPTITNEGAQYIKGKVIRLEGLESEFHLANSIANELNQGVYI